MTTRKPLGTVAMTKVADEYADEIPVWVKTVNGWFYVIPYDSSCGLMESITEEDFGDDWLFIEPEGVVHG